MKEIRTIKKVIRRQKPIALPRQTAKFAENCMADLYEEFFALAAIIADKRANA